MCLPYPPSGWIRLNMDVWWCREECLVQRLEKRICPRSVLDCGSGTNWKIWNTAIMGGMVVMTSNFHCRSPFFTTRNQIYSLLLPQNWHVWSLDTFLIFPKILSLKSFGNSQGNLYIPCLWAIIAHRFTCGERKIW